MLQLARWSMLAYKQQKPHEKCQRKRFPLQLLPLSPLPIYTQCLCVTPRTALECRVRPEPARALNNFTALWKLTKLAGKKEERAEKKEEEEEDDSLHAQAWLIKSKVKTLQRFLGVKAHVKTARKQESVSQSGCVLILKAGWNVWIWVIVIHRGDNTTTKYLILCNRWVKK